MLVRPILKVCDVCHMLDSGHDKEDGIKGLINGIEGEGERDENYGEEGMAWRKKMKRKGRRREGMAYGRLGGGRRGG